MNVFTKRHFLPIPPPRWDNVETIHTHFFCLRTTVIFGLIPNKLLKKRFRDKKKIRVFFLISDTYYVNNSYIFFETIDVFTDYNMEMKIRPFIIIHLYKNEISD